MRCKQRIPCVQLKNDPKTEYAKTEDSWRRMRQRGPDPHPLKKRSSQRTRAFHTVCTQIYIFVNWQDGSAEVRVPDGGDAARKLEPEPATAVRVTLELETKIPEDVLKILGGYLLLYAS